MIRKPEAFLTTIYYRYNQAHAPIAEQESVEGHSVRMVYLLTAVADLVDLEGSSAPKNLPPALYRLWDNMVQRKMYVTGGIGAMKQWEGFGLEHFLPQGTDEGGCYSETCAAIGVMMVAQRVLNVRLRHLSPLNITVSDIPNRSSISTAALQTSWNSACSTPC